MEIGSAEVMADFEPIIWDPIVQGHYNNRDESPTSSPPKLQGTKFLNVGTRRSCSSSRDDVTSRDLSRAPSLNIDGTWKHGFVDLTRAQREWLIANGWNL